VKKIISILVALGLVLGLTVVATPVMAACTDPVTNCAVTPLNPVACNVTCYNVTFNVTNPLSAGQWIRVEFPATTDLSGIAGALCSLTTAGVTTPLLATDVASAGPLVRDFKVPAALAAGVAAGAGVILQICNVGNPTTGGALPMVVKTETDTCPCLFTLTILDGATISPSSVTWCPCHNVTTNITWGAASYIVQVDGVAFPDAQLLLTGNKTLSINCSLIAALAAGSTSCDVITVPIGFNAGCNATLTITIAEAYNITLVNGWNLISLPLIPTTADPVTFEAPIEDVLKDVLANVVSVWYFDGCTEKWGAYRNGPGTTWDFGLTTMSTRNSYWVCSNSTTPITIQLCGFRLPCPPGGPPCYCYCHCWNMVGYHSTNTSLNLSDYTANLSPAGSLFGALTYNASGWATVYPSTTMVPGLGYWMAFTAEPACFAPPV